MARTILLTGATGKLGRTFAAHFAACNDRVIAVGRNAERLDAIRAGLGTNAQFTGLQYDLAQPNAAAELTIELSRSGIQPEYLINNARNIDYLKLPPDGRVSRENFAGEFLVDVIAPYELTMALAEQPGSKLRGVVNIGSQYGSVAANTHLYDDPKTQSPLHYGVAKAALAHLTKELAVRLAPRGILVNCVAFGGIEGRVDDGFKARYARLTPLGRMLTEAEIIGPVDMLLSSSLSGMTGQIVGVDGGWTLW